MSCLYCGDRQASIPYFKLAIIGSGLLISAMNAKVMFKALGWDVPWE